MSHFFIFLLATLAYNLKNIPGKSLAFARNGQMFSWRRLLQANMLGGEGGGGGGEDGRNIYAFNNSQTIRIPIVCTVYLGLYSIYGISYLAISNNNSTDIQHLLSSSSTIFFIILLRIKGWCIYVPRLSGLVLKYLYFEYRFFTVNTLYLFQRDLLSLLLGTTYSSLTRHYFLVLFLSPLLLSIF